MNGKKVAESSTHFDVIGRNDYNFMANSAAKTILMQARPSIISELNAAAENGSVLTHSSFEATPKKVSRSFLSNNMASRSGYTKEDSKLSKPCISGCLIV